MRAVSAAAPSHAVADLRWRSHAAGARTPAAPTRYAHRWQVGEKARLQRRQGLSVHAQLTDNCLGEPSPDRASSLLRPQLSEPGTGNDRLRLISGSAHPGMAEEIAAYMGIRLTKCTLKHFADGENYVQILETIRGCDVFLIQPTCPPVHDNLMELMQLIDACRRASARTITAVIPYFGYARADRKSTSREAIAAKLVANLLTEAGAQRILALDLHSGQLEGYFDLPVVHIHAAQLLADYVRSRIPAEDIVVVSPDVGGVARARAFAKSMADAPLAIIDKRRTGHNQAQVMNLIGDVKGRCAVLVDDMIDTAGTLQAGAELLHAKGARAVYAAASHAVLSGPAVSRLSTGLFEEVIVTNSIPQTAGKLFPQLTVLSVADLVGEAISRVYNETSVSRLSGR